MAPWRIGAPLMEEDHVDRRYGSFINQDLANYHAVVNADSGAMDAVFLDEADPHGNPLGSKGIGELGIRGAGAGAMNAICNATGAPFAISLPHPTSCRLHPKRSILNQDP